MKVRLSLEKNGKHMMVHTEHAGKLAAAAAKAGDKELAAAFSTIGKRGKNWLEKFGDAASVVVDEGNVSVLLEQAAAVIAGAQG